MPASAPPNDPQTDEGDTRTHYRTCPLCEATCGVACLVAPGDARALRAALEPLIADAGVRAQLAGACWQAAQGFARWPDTAAAVAAVLRGVGR